MKVRRYNESGRTQRKGIEATFCVKWFVIESRSVDAQAASRIHKSCSRRRGGRQAPPAAPGEAFASRAPGTMSRRPAKVAARQSATKTVKADDQARDCCRRVAFGSMKTG